MEQRFKLCSKAVIQDLETNFNAEECCMLWVNYLEYLYAFGQKDRVIPLLMQEFESDKDSEACSQPEVPV